MLFDDGGSQEFCDYQLDEMIKKGEAKKI